MCSKCDPVVQRVRAARREIMAECGGDLHALFERARRIQAEFPGRVVGYEDIHGRPRTAWPDPGAAEDTENGA